MAELHPIQIIRLPTRLLFGLTRAHRREFVGILMRQVYFTFVQSIPIVIGLGMITGTVFALQAHWGLSILGGQEKLGEVMVYVIFRELTPLATIILLIARSVTAVASEVSTMKVGSEIDALEVLGIDTTVYLFGPRVFAGALSLLCMANLFWFGSIGGAWVGANLTGHIPLNQLLASLVRAISIPDILFFILKTSMPGAMVFYLACVRSNGVGHSPHEVPIATNRSVVDSMLVSLLIHIAISASFYFIFGF